MNILDVVAFGVGGILVYSAVKDENPVDVIKNALNGKSASSSGPKDGTSTSTKLPDGKQFVDGTGGVGNGTYSGNGGIGPGDPISYEPVYPSPVFTSV